MDLPSVAAQNTAEEEQNGGKDNGDGENGNSRETPSCPTPAGGGADLASDFVEKNLDAMVGDVNLFLSEEEPDTDDENDDVCVGNSTTSAAASAT